MSIAKIDQVVRVEGRIIPAGRSQQIQHLEGGILSSISVHEGSSVRKGDLLLTIDNTTAGASLSETNSKLTSQRAHALRLQAEVEGRETLEFPPELARLPVTEAELKLFKARREKLRQETGVHESMLRQRNAEYQEAKSRTDRLATEMITATQRTQMLENMAKNGAASKLEVLDARSRQERLKTEMGEVTGSLPKLEAAISEEKGRIETARSNFRAEAQNDLVAALAESERLGQIVAAAADRLKRTEIRAPADGIINRMAVNTVGGVIKPGETLVEITPITDQVLIEAKAIPRDRGHLRTNLKTHIRVSAYDAAEYGLLQGHITEVSADSFQDPRSDPYYQVGIAVDALPDRYKGLEMVPGMTITADIVTGQRTLLSHILSPLLKFTHNMFRDSR